MNFARLFSSSRSSKGAQSERTVRAFAPGRANLIGEHTDYNGGMCVPFALDLGITCQAQFKYRNQNPLKASDPFLKIDSEMKPIGSLTLEKWQQVLRECQNLESRNLAEFGEVVFSLLPKGSSAYIVGSLAWYFTHEKIIQHQAEFLSTIFEGRAEVSLSLQSTLPQGAGLSSSAALCMSVLTAVNEVCDQELSVLELCKIAQHVEHTFVGTKCGLMDQMASGLGQAKHFLQINFGTVTPDPLPWRSKDPWHTLVRAHSIFDQYTPLLFHTGVSHSLATSEYNLRRSQCQQALELLQDPFEEFTQERPETLGELSSAGWESLLEVLEWEPSHPDAVSQSQLKQALLSFFARKVSPQQAQILAKRSAHAIFENRRVTAAAIALSRGLPVALGQILADGHVSLDQDYEVSCRELNLAALFLSQAAHQISPERGTNPAPAASPPIVGPRMTGGGFGGSVVAFVLSSLKEQLTEVFSNSQNPYTNATGLRPQLIWSQPGSGARILQD